MSKKFTAREAAWAILSLPFWAMLFLALWYSLIFVYSWAEGTLPE